MITFSCDAYENIIYFSDIAKSLLTLMGHSGTVPGALKAEEVAQALAHLEQGLKGQAYDSDLALEDKEEEPKIGLAKRAIPLISLLKAAVDKKCDVLWT